MGKRIVIPCEMPTSTRFKDITGQVVNGLACIGFAGRKGDRYAWEFRCHCGNTFVAIAKDVKRGNTTSCGCGVRSLTDRLGESYSGIEFLEVGEQRKGVFRCHCGKVFRCNHTHVFSGHTRSCGCLRSANARLTIQTAHRANAKHGKARTRIYKCYHKMISRCYVATDRKYPQYGGRGITVCDKWRNSFEAFLGDMGLPPTKEHSIDRINNNGPYSPDNCRWATRKQQQNNTRANVYIQYNGQSLTFFQWKDTGVVQISNSGFKRRVSNGWCIECALTQPKGGRCVHH